MQVRVDAEVPTRRGEVAHRCSARWGVPTGDEDPALGCCSAPLAVPMITSPQDPPARASSELPGWRAGG